MTLLRTFTKDPHKILDGNDYGMDFVQYPEDVAGADELGHYMIFYIHQTIGSKFATKSKMQVLGQESQAFEVAALKKTFRDTVRFNEGASGEALLKLGVLGGVLKAFGDSNSVVSGLQTVVEYGAEGAGYLMAGESRLQRTTELTTEAIVLYMPGDIRVNYSTTWEGVDTSDLTNVAQAIKKTADSSKTGVGNLLLDAAANAGDVIEPFLLKNAGKVGLQSLADIASVSRRQAINPHLEFLFKTVAARTFNFDFKFFPKTRSEQRNIDKIIHLFKLHAHPEKRDGGVGAFWSYPSNFDIQFFSKGIENHWINKIKTCALTSVSVNYTAAGVWAAHKELDGKGSPPAYVELTVKFQELGLLEKSDIEEGY